MHSSEARLSLFHGAPLEYRFASPRWRQSLRPAVWESLAAGLAAVNPRRCRRLVFGDGPLAHPRFFELLAEARTRQIPGISVETDGRALAADGVIDRLVEAGVEKVFVVLGGGRPKVHDQVMQDPGAFVEAIEGTRRAASSRLELYVVMPVIRWSEKDIEPFLHWLIEHAKPKGFLLALPLVSRVQPSARAALLPYGEIAALAARIFTVCARSKVEYGFSHRRALPPCAALGEMDRFGTFFFDRIDYLRLADPAEFDRIDACGECSLKEVCPGVERAYLDHFGRAGFAAIPLTVSMDWKLKQVNKLDGRDFKNVSDFHNDDASRQRSLIRINGHCNMSCAFCFVDRTVPDFPEGEILAAIERLAARNLTHLVLSGGEPTLHPALPRFIARAKELGFQTIEVQTNGVKTADLDYARSLVDAGLNKVTCSLHSVDPAHSDKITRLPGGFWKTVRSLHHFRALGVLTQVAHVVTRDNYQELPETVRFLRAQYPDGGGHLSICFGVAQPISDLVYTWVLPRFDEIKPYMRAALNYCLETHVGFGGMIGQGAYPPCMLDGDMRYYAHNLQNIYRSPDYEDQFFKPEQCRECSFDPYCMGVRRIYVETYGDAEIRPFQVDLTPLLPDFLRPLPPGESSEKSVVFAERHSGRHGPPTAGGLVQLRGRREGSRSD
ncbi:MAG: radical SAM protein [Planctomycetota bacterium]